MNSQRFIIIPALFLILLISGCVLPTDDPFQSQTPEGTGVIIESFGPDFPEVYSNEEVKFTLKIKNTGSVKAENCFAEVLGIDQVWKPGVNAEVINQEVLPDEPNCKYTSPPAQMITLLPEDPDSGITGGEATCTWRYEAPEVLPGLKINSQPRVRVFYSYKSATIKSITLVSREELKSLQDQGKGLPSETSSTTKSPISFDIESQSPIRTYGNFVEFPIVITIKNVGGGNVCSSIDKCKKSQWGEPGEWSAGEGWYNMNFEIVIPSGIQFVNCASKQNVVLIGNEPQKVSCKLKADAGQQIGIMQKNIEIRSQYGYFIDKTADVVVYPSTSG